MTIKPCKSYEIGSTVHKVLGEVLAIREKQDAQWGGTKHDDQHQSYDWIKFIERNMKRASKIAWDDHAADRAEYEQKLLNTAALAVAAVQSSRRKRGL